MTRSSTPLAGGSPLLSLGWDDRWSAALAACSEPELLPGRIVGGSAEQLRVLVSDPSTGGLVDAEALVPGRLLYRAESPVELPCVGDWVALRRSDDARAPIAAHLLVEEVLPRRSLFVRRAAGRRAEAQALAANVDLAFLVAALDGDWSRRRLERWLALVREAGASAVLVLTKRDLASAAALDEAIGEAAVAAPDVAVHAVDARLDAAVEALHAHLTPGTTAVLLGSSGVGKSTLVNRLVGGTRAATGEVDRDGLGRHTTSGRELLRLPGGALLIDTPGLREVGLWLGDSPLVELFPEIAEAAARCRFRDCRHDGEPGCAVAAEIAAGRIATDRLASLRQLDAERAFVARRNDQRAAQEEKRRVKAIHKQARREPRKVR